MNLGFYYFAVWKNEAKLPFEKKTIILNLQYEPNAIESKFWIPIKLVNYFFL